MLAGETLRCTKPVSSHASRWCQNQTILQDAMLFTEELGRKKFASKVVLPPQNVFDLAEALSSRMHR